MYLWIAKKNKLVKGEWEIYYCGELFCHVSDSDLILFEDLCERAGSPLGRSDA